MFTNLVSWHLAHLNTNFPAQNQVFVYKGLPVSFVLAIATTFPLVDAQSIMASGQIDLDYIDQAIFGYVGHLQKPAIANRIMLYEEFLKLSQEVRSLNRLGCQFVVFDNTFYRQVPNQSTPQLCGRRMAY